MSIVSQLVDRFGKRRLVKFFSLYPPYLGAGIRVASVEGDIDAVTIAMPLNRMNQNYLGTHFGGSLYSMCDPWFMLLMLWKLGDGHVVWDKAATIRFLKPGRGRVTARFEVPDARVVEVRAELERVGKVAPVFQANVLNADGEIVAQVEKVLSVKRAMKTT